MISCLPVLVVLLIMMKKGFAFHGTFLHRIGRSSILSRSLLSSVRSEPTVIDGVQQLIHKYDVFLLDQFGVLHDGVKPLDGVIDVLRDLHSRGKKTVIVSNSSSRKQSATKRYDDLGIPNYYDDFVTSGETSWEYLAEHYKGKTCLWFTWQSFPKDSFLRSLGIIPTSNVEDADFLLFHGSQCLVTSPFDMDGTSSIPMALCMTGQIDLHIEEVLLKAAKRKLPSICANLDMTAVTRGKTLYMPGHLHHRYKQLLQSQSPQYEHLAKGFGKPNPLFFQRGIHKAAQTVNASNSNSIVDAWIQNRRILHVGDSLHHDIAGACATGIDSLLITHHGVHRSAYHTPTSTAHSTVYDKERLLKTTLQLSEEEKTPLPTYIMPSFRL